MKSHRKEWKEKEVREITELLKKYDILAVADIQQFPANLIQSLRKKLHNKAELRVSKKKIIQLAIKNSGKTYEEINNYLKGNTLLIFTNTNPFELYSIVKKAKGKLFAKEGSNVTREITVPAGDTGIPPGPALTDLKNAGLNVRPQGATIHVMKDTIVARPGEPVKAAVASVLQKLNIKALELSMPIRVAFDSQFKYTEDVMNIDTDALEEKFTQAHSNALKLALGIGYPSKDTLPIVIQKLARDSFVLALETNYLNKKTAPHILGKAEKIAKHLKSLLK